MTNASSSPNSDDEILAQIVREWEHANPGAPGPDLDACVRRYPHLETQIRELHEMRQAVESSRPETLSSMPERLGEFRIVRRMEVGPMGEIYEAVQERLGRRVVVKVLPRGRHSPDARARFMREQQVLARLHQTHIVPIHTAGCEGKIEYFVMPYIAGSALRHVVRTAAEFGSTQPNTQTPSLAVLIERAKSGGSDAPTGSYSIASESDEPDDPRTLEPATSSSLSLFKPSMDYLRSVARVMADAATALQHAHELGIYHRDIKPSNIMVEVQRQLGNGAETRSDYVEKCWVIDFGLASYRNGHTASVHQASPAFQASQASREASAPGLRHDELGVDRCDERHASREASAAGLHPDPGADALRLARDASHALRLAADASPAELLGARRLDPSHPLRSGADAPPDFIPAASGIMGTPQYMAPEQFDGKADARSDVWGLGVTLYELLTLRRAFPKKNAASVAENLAYFRDQIQLVDPPRPRGQLPHDLKAICFKAIQKLPTKRYQTVREFGEDLRRWLRDEPVRARKSSVFRRVSLWAKRNKGWATTLALAFFSCVSLSVVVARYKERAQEGERQGLMRVSQEIRQLTRSAGWAESVWQLNRQAAMIRTDETLRDQSAACVAGLDARIRKQFKFGASSVVFDRDGKGLLMGGTTDDGDRPRSGAKFWDGGIDEPIVSVKAGAGPVAFDANGTPLQLVREFGSSLLLWNVAEQRAVHEFKPTNTDGSDPNSSLVIGQMAMTPDASFIAASISERGGHTNGEKGSVAIWDATSGKLVHNLKHAAGALCFSPDGTILAGGDEDGWITVWSLRTGDQIAHLQAARNEINSLAVTRDPLRRKEMEHLAQNATAWLVAAGDSGGAITVWDINAQALRSHYLGSHYNIYALAFSPDGTILASGGRAEGRLWDVASERLLLTLPTGDYFSCFAWSADSRKLVVSTDSGSTEDNVLVWELDYGRGIHTLRGLVAQVTKLCFSTDSHLLAALSLDWHVAIWDLRTGELRYILETPKGFWADNAALAFSPDGNKLAFATGRAAKLWDLASGGELRSWDLPPGLTDHIAFHPSGGLLLFRVETKDMKHIPASAAPPHEHPRVCRIRNLLGVEPTRPTSEIEDFNSHVFVAAMTSDGASIVVDGLAGLKGEQRMISAFDGPTGNLLWSLPNLPRDPHGMLSVDPEGKFMAPLTRPGNYTLLEVRTKKIIGTARQPASALAPGARLSVCIRANVSTPGGFACELVRAEETKPLVTMVIQPKVWNSHAWFSPTGSLVAWGNTDGTVSLFDMNEVQTRLAELGLGW